MEIGAVAVWVVLFLALLVVGLPIAGALFPELPDRGASVSIPIVFLVVCLVSYYVGRVSIRAAAIASLFVLGGLIALGRRRGTAIETESVVEVALVFTAAFGFLVAARSVDPAIVPAGGEKFMDYGLLKATLRTETLPPADFWYAGEPMQYYYGGHLIVAQLVRLTGTAPGVAYNLALAGFYATYVTAAYGLAGTVAARADAFERRAALLAAFFVGLAGTLFTPIRVLLRPLPDDIAEGIAKPLAVWAGRFEDSSQGAVITDREPFSMWDATGVIDGTIHEMPLFAYVNGDLHAHMMAPPFTLLAATVLLAYWRTPASARSRRRWLLFGVVPAIAGGLAIVNTWSFPSIAGLTFLAVLFDRGAIETLGPSAVRTRLADAGGLPRALGSVVTAGLSAVAVALIGLVWSLPFWLTTASSRSIVVLPERSSLAELLVVHGGFLIPIGVYLGYLARAQYDLSRHTVAALALVVVLASALTAWLSVPVLGLFGPLLLGGYLLGSRASEAIADRRSVTGRLPVEEDRLATLPGFEIVLVLGAGGLVMLAEFVYLADAGSAGRFNTVFKLYAQVWAFFAVGTAIALARLLQLSAVSAPMPRWPTVLRGFVAVLLVTLSVYGAIAMGLHFGEFAESGQEATIDGTAHLDQRYPDRAAAVAWLDDRDGLPTIVTASGESYTWDSWPSAFTGVPTILGWKNHERVWGRSATSIHNRSRDVTAIYGGDHPTQRRLLAEYDVSYVLVGAIERERYGDAITVDEVRAVSPAETVGEVTIYEVDQAALGNGEN